MKTNIAEKHNKAQDILCERVEVTDGDGQTVRPGKYCLTKEGRATLKKWGVS